MKHQIILPWSLMQLKSLLLFKQDRGDEPKPKKKGTFFISPLFLIGLFAGLLWLLEPFPSFAQQIENLKDQKPFTLQGSLGTNLIFYHASGIPERMRPFSYVLSANATANLYGIAMPFSFIYSDRQRNYTQPFNQFGISPSYKWATVHLGYRNVRFSDFTLAGHSFLGGGVELNPGKLRFGMVYGRFRRSTESHPQAIDTIPSFKRKGLAIKIGVGSPKNFVDFNFLNIKDDSTSLIGTEIRNNATPAQNMVAGFNTHLTFSKAVSFDAEIAGSLFTHDMKAPSLGDLNDVPVFSGLEKFFLINQSTAFYTAIRSSLLYKTKGVSTKLEYRRIDPGYKSMGAYFFNNDIENITIAPAFTLFKRKLALRGSVGVQRDNLRNTKKATARRVISSFNVSYNPGSKFGIDAAFSNYSNNQRAGRVPLVDSLKVFTTTSNLSISPRLMFISAEKSHMIMLLFNRMSLNDRNPQSAQMAETQATLINAGYNLSLNASMLSFFLSVNHTMLENFMMVSKASGGSLGVSKSLQEGRLSASFNNALQRTTQLEEKGWVFNSSLNLSWNFLKKNSLRFGLFYINTSYPDGSVNPSFKEFKGDLSYVYTF